MATEIMMTSSNGNIFRVIGPLWGESAGDRWIMIWSYEVWNAHRDAGTV